MPQQKRKVWPWVLLGVFGLMFAGCGILTVGALVASEVAKETETAAPSGATPAPAADKVVPAKPAKKNSDGTVQGVIGRPVTNAGMSYTVTKVAKTTSLDEGYTTPEDGAVFVIVDLTLVNRKNETKTFNESNAKLMSSGLSFETTSKTFGSFGDRSLFLKAVQPGLPTKGKLGFEVPTTKLAGAALVIEDLWGDGKVSIPLGLR